MSMSKSRRCVGVDIGGTKIAGGVVTRDGEILRRIEGPTNASEGGPRILARAADLIGELIASSPGGVCGIGVAVGGQVHPETGVVFSATPLIPNWVGVRIKDILEERFGVPVRAMNDATAAAVGEWRFGAARGVDDFVLLTIGTGVGGGVFSDGKLLEGALGAAGAIGHMVIDCDGRPCNCGSRGCLEAYTSGLSIANRAIELASERGMDNDLVRAIRADVYAGAKLLGEAAKSGDQFALEVIREAGEYLGWGLASLLNLFNPSLVVIGGSMAELGDIFLGPAWEIAQKHCLRRDSDPARLVTAQLGNDAGLLGAASLVLLNTDGTDGKG
jgi:glucokinase